MAALAALALLGAMDARAQLPSGDYWITDGTRMVHYDVNGQPDGWDLAVSLDGAAVTIKVGAYTTLANNAPVPAVNLTLPLGDPIFNLGGTPCQLVEIADGTGSTSPFFRLSNMPATKNNIIALTLPQNTLTNIGHYAFNQLANLAGSLVIPNSVLNIGNYAFADCANLAGSLAIPDSVLNIGECAFYACGFNGAFSLGNSVLNIGNYAFEGCAFKGDLTIPANVKSVGRYAFGATTYKNAHLVFGGKLTVESADTLLLGCCLGYCTFEWFPNLPGRTTLGNADKYATDPMSCLWPG